MESADRVPDISPDAVWVDGYRRLSPAAGISLGLFQILTVVAEELEVSSAGMAFNDLIEASELEGDEFLEAMEELTDTSLDRGIRKIPLLHVFQMADGALSFTLSDKAWSLLRRTTH